jgi:TRAP-type mannitol/chloroaromatic compound transport system permease large subunit
MIDITKIQLNSIPPSLVSLQQATKQLESKNKLLKNILIMGGISLGLYLTYCVIKSINKRKKNETNDRRKP